MRYFEKESAKKDETRLGESLVIPTAVGAVAGAAGGAYTGFKLKPYTQAADVMLDAYIGTAGKDKAEILNSIADSPSAAKKVIQDLVESGSKLRTSDPAVKAMVEEGTKAIDSLKDADPRLKGLGNKLKSLAEIYTTKKSPTYHYYHPGKLALRGAGILGALGLGLGATYYGAKKITE